jgi:hypothetical protein
MFRSWRTTLPSLGSTWAWSRRRPRGWARGSPIIR